MNPVTSKISFTMSLQPTTFISPFQVFISFFNQYKQEVEAHFLHEERDVFPHIRALMAGERDKTYGIDVRTGALIPKGRLLMVPWALTDVPKE